MDKRSKTTATVIAAVLAAGCVPAAAMAQAAVPDQAPSVAEQQASLRDRVLAGETVYPEGGYVRPDGVKDISKAAPDGWKPCAYSKDGKVYLEIGPYTSAKLFWTVDEIEGLDPDVVITKDYDENCTFTIEGDFYTYNDRFEGPDPLYVKSMESVKVDCIKPGALDMFASADYAFTGPDGAFGDVETRGGGFPFALYTDTVIIGKNVTKLKDGWAFPGIKHFVFEKGSKLKSVGKADIGDFGPKAETIEGLPSGAKLKDGALALPNLEKVTKPSGADYKVPESALKSSFATAPLSKSYWPGALAKARSITVSATAKKGGKSAFAKVHALKYAKGKVTKLRGGKYKKAAKAQAAKVTVSKTGKVVVSKGLKKGTYKVKAKASVAGHSKTVTATVKVK